MIKQALEYILSLSEPNYRLHGTLTYADKNMHTLRNEPTIIPLETATLKSLVEYIKRGVDANGHLPRRCEIIDDKITPVWKYVLHVSEYNTVYLYDELNVDAHRQCRVRAIAETPNLRLNQYVDLETMNIMLQSNFVATEARDMVLALIGSVSDGQVIDHLDDGISQKVTVKAGIHRVGLEGVPNPVLLAPFRTFAEVEQPESLFVLRMKSGQDQPQAALFEADGGAWKIAARRNIEQYFVENLCADNGPAFVILA